MLEIIYQNEETREVIYRLADSDPSALVHTIFETWPDDVMAACEREYQRTHDLAQAAGDQENSEEI